MIKTGEFFVKQVAVSNLLYDNWLTRKIFVLKLSQINFCILLCFALIYVCLYKVIYKAVLLHFLNFKIYIFTKIKKGSSVKNS